MITLWEMWGRISWVLYNYGFYEGEDFYNWRFDGGRFENIGSLTLLYPMFWTILPAKLKTVN